MKTKYERMTKEEKIKLKKAYKSESKGREMLLRLTRINVIGILLILYAVGYFLFHFKALKWTVYLVSIPLLLFGIFFLFMSHRLKKKVLNQFAIKQK